MEENKQKVTIGIDVSKNKLDIYYLPTKEHKVIVNQPRQIGQWLRTTLRQYTIEIVALEPTGGYEKPLLQQLLKRELTIEYVHPNRLNNFQAVNGEVAKTDKIASSQLARYAADPQYRHNLIKQGHVERTCHGELSSRIKQLKQMIQMEKNRLEKPLYNAQVKKSIRKHIKHLEKELKHLENQAEALIKEDATLNATYELIQTFKGAGKTTAQTLILDVPELGTLSKAKISSLIGLAPINRDSGKKQGQRYIQGGRGHVRRVLYMTAMVAIRYNKTMRVFYDRMRSTGKPFKVAIVAVMRKLLCTLNAMVRDKLPWLEDKELAAQ